MSIVLCKMLILCWYVLLYSHRSSCDVNLVLVHKAQAYINSPSTASTYELFSHLYCEGVPTLTASLTLGII